MTVANECLKCKLYQQGCKTYKMPGSGSEEPEIIFVGEAPGYNEDETGTPFVGQAGQLLRESLQELNLPLDKIRFTNAVRCRPPNNRTPTAAEVKACMPFLTEELTHYQPRVVVLLGNTPLKAVLGLNGISSYQGQGAIERDGVKYVPAYHPSFILRQGGSAAAMEDWLRSMGDIINAYEGTEAVQAADAHYDYIIPMSVDELLAMRDELLANPDELIACDVEGISIRLDLPGNKIISIAFANSTKAWTFPVDHKESWWNAEERAWVQAIITDVLTGTTSTVMPDGLGGYRLRTVAEPTHQPKIINHNMKFDCKIIRHLLGIDFVPSGDTIQLSRLVNPDALEHGLKRLAGIHLGMFDYDDELNQYVAAHPECDYKRGGNYGNIPLDVLLPYGGKDVSATRMLHDKLYAELTPLQCALYDQMLILADYAIGRIEQNGFRIDYDLVKRYMNVYQSIMATNYMPAMLDDPHVQMWMRAQNLYNKLEMAGLLTKEKVGKRYRCALSYGGNVYHFDKADWHEFYVLNQQRLDTLDVDYQFKRKLPKVEFNPNSGQQVAPIIYTYKKLVRDPSKIVRTDSGGMSVKRTVLKEVVYDMNGEGRSDPFMDHYMNWKLLSSIVSKTFKSMLNNDSDWHSYDGRVRSTYTIGGAMTGRTSSAEPNLQNIPAIEKEPGTVLQYLPAKNAFTFTFPGGGLAMLDYSGMELRVICSIAGIQGMIDVFNRKGDVHKYTSSLIYRKPESEITKFERYRGKWCNWSLLYLGNWWTLVRLYRINGVTEDEAKRVAALYFEAFPELPRYHKTIEQLLLQNGYVESAFGRRLSLPAIYDSNEAVRGDALRTAVNFPIQGVASDTLMVALAIITQIMRGKNFRSMFVNTVHDSLVIDYHPEELDYVVKLSMEVMENVVDYAAKWMPGLDFSWLKVPLVADVEYGTHYGSYGHYQPVMSSCGAEMLLIGDTAKKLIDDQEVMALTYECPSCDDIVVKPVKPLLYNNTHPTALYMREQWHRVIYNNDYVGPRKPRLN